VRILTYFQLATAACALVVAPLSAAPNLQVSPDGRDTGDGSAARPFATLARAQAEVKRLKNVVGEATPITVELAPGTFFAVRRELRSGDEVRLEMPMAWRLVKGRQRQAGRVAVMRGPQVFCLDPAQHPALAKLDGTELGYLALNPDSLGEPVGNTAVRPDGLGCGVQMWKPGFGLGKKADYELTLTEFPNAEGKATYFRLRDYSLAVDDELFSDR